MEYSTSFLCTVSFVLEGVSAYLLLLPRFTEIPAFNANSVDPDQTPRSMTSNLGYTVCKFPLYRMLGINGLMT